MKRRPHAYPRWRWRTGGFLLAAAGFVLFVLLKLQMLAMPDSPGLPESPVLTNLENPQFTNTTKPKLAFMFIARQHMPLDILWERFFEVNS